MMYAIISLLALLVMFAAGFVSGYSLVRRANGRNGDFSSAGGLSDSETEQRAAELKDTVARAESSNKQAAAIITKMEDLLARVRRGDLGVAGDSSAEGEVK